MEGDEIVEEDYIPHSYSRQVPAVGDYIGLNNKIWIVTLRIWTTFLNERAMVPTQMVTLHIRQYIGKPFNRPEKPSTIRTQKGFN